MKLKLNRFLALLLVLMAQVTFAQNITVNGVVTDASGMPIPGANVLIKGTTTGGVQTDFDGKFQIAAAQGQSLVFSFVGMKTIEMPASLNMKVTLVDDSVQLEGVVVTALGITREKKSLGYATQKVDGEEANRLPSTNFINNLSGKIAGVAIKNNGNFGGSTNVVIRGYKSISFNNQALFVIDGVVLDNSNTNDANQRTGRFGYDFGNAASDINPADIESINVLKGAAATALYGSRAANGAIMITTKKGKQNQGGLGVTFESGISIGSIDKETFVDYQKTYGEGYRGQTFRQRDLNGDGVNDDVAWTPDDASFGPIYDSTRNVYQWDSFIPESPYYKVARPWKKAENGPITFFETPYTHTNTIGLSGGTDKGVFSVSATNTMSNGILPNSEQRKNSVVGNASFKLTDKLRASFFSNYINTYTKGRNGTGYNGNIVGNFRQWWATNVDINELKDIYFSTRKNYTWNAISPANIAPAFWNNPYFERYENYEDDTRNRFIGNATVNYQLTSWLDIMGRLTVDTYSELQEERKANGSYGGDSFGLPTLSPPNQASGYQRFNRNRSEFNYDLMLNFNQDLGNKFNIKGVAGINIRREKVNSILAATSGGLYVPKLYSLSNSQNLPERPEEVELNRGVDGYYIQASLGYSDFFYIDGSYRADVSSTLPEGDNDYYYPSVSASLVFSNLIDQDWLSLGKLRGGYAEVGNDAPFDQLRTSYAANGSFTNGTADSLPLFSAPSTRNNENLKSEKTKSIEVGLEMQFFKKRIGFDVSAYKTNTFDQIISLPASEATGYTQLLKNVGNVENKGIEATLNIVPLQSQNFRWDITANWAVNENELIELDPRNPEVKNYQIANFQAGVSVNATVGEPLGVIKGSDYVYTNGQRTVDANGNYIISSTNDHNLGNFNPKWTGGLNNRFEYKNVSFSFLIDVQKGGDVFSLDRWYGEGTGLYQNTVFNNDLGNPVRNSIANGGGLILPGVFADGTPNNVRIETTDGQTGKFGYLGSANSEFVYDASYVKLREVTLGYTFSKKVLNNTFQDIYIGFTGTNLWIIDKNLPDADPETALSSGNIQGFQSGVLPTVRTFAMNLKAKF